MTADLGRIEAVLDASGVASRIEELLPVGVRPRQLRVRTLICGLLVCQGEGRPAHLTRVLRALWDLDEPERRRLGVVVDWPSGAHTLTYRQLERTFSLVVAVLEKPEPDGTPSALLQEVTDAFVEASVEGPFKEASGSLALDWTDVESFSSRRTNADGDYTDKEAAWGHRKGGGPGEKDELFFGYYLSLATMVEDRGGGRVPELVRRMNLVGCDHDPVPHMVDVVVEMPKAGVPLGDVVADSGYAHRVPEHFALPLRSAGAQLVMDLHPHDRGSQGTHRGAIVHHGNLYCPMTPRGLLGQAPLARGASAEQTDTHDKASEELSRYKLGRVMGDDADGYHRVMCPALMGKVRCPLRPGSGSLPLERPEILSVPEHPPACCTQKTVTVPPAVGAKTAQRHDYPSKAWRRSYARRSAVERSNSRVKDPATVDITRGWCRMMGLVPMTLCLACALVVRNLAVADAFVAHQEDDRRRTAAGRPPRTRRRRRTTLAQLAGASSGAPP